MSNQKYFNSFSNTYYNDYKATNIMQRAALLESVYNNPFVYYPYELKDGDRADRIAGDYYTDKYATWMIYYANKIIDPYYDWFLDDSDFNKFIVEKYGSIENAQRKVKFYRVSWADDDSEISPSFYENTLLEDLKKYWEPQYAPNGRVLSYKRADQDFIMNTNLILKINITKNSNTNFSNGEIVTISQSGNNVGNAEIITSNSSVMTIQHVGIEHVSFDLGGDEYDELTPNVTFQISGVSSNASANVVTYILAQRNIPLAETSYWERVTYYDFETELNTQNRNIYLLDSKYYVPAKEELRKAFKE